MTWSPDLVALYSLGSVGVCRGFLACRRRTANLSVFFFSLNSVHLCLSASLGSSLRLLLSHAVLPRLLLLSGVILFDRVAVETDGVQATLRGDFSLSLDGDRKSSSDV